MKVAQHRLQALRAVEREERLRSIEVEAHIGAAGQHERVVRVRPGALDHDDAMRGREFPAKAIREDDASCAGTDDDDRFGVMAFLPFSEHEHAAGLGGPRCELFHVASRGARCQLAVSDLRMVPWIAPCFLC